MSQCYQNCSREAYKQSKFLEWKYFRMSVNVPGNSLTGKGGGEISWGSRIQRWDRTRTYQHFGEWAGLDFKRISVRWWLQYQVQALQEREEWGEKIWPRQRAGRNTQDLPSVVAAQIWIKNDSDMEKRENWGPFRAVWTKSHPSKKLSKIVSDLSMVCMFCTTWTFMTSPKESWEL